MQMHVKVMLDFVVLKDSIFLRDEIVVPLLTR